MSSPVRAATDGDSYTRMTVSLDGWGVEMGAGPLFLECGLMLKGNEGVGGVAACTCAVVFVCSTHFFTLMHFSRVNWSCACACHVQAFGAACMSLPIIACCCPFCSRPMKKRDIDGSLWFREIYGGQHAFGKEPAAVA